MVFSWVCSLGCVPLGMFSWVCSIGYVLLGVFSWVCSTGCVLLGVFEKKILWQSNPFELRGYRHRTDNNSHLMINLIYIYIYIYKQKRNGINK